MNHGELQRKLSDTSNELVLVYSNEFEVVGYADSDFTSSLDDMTSISGYIFKLNGGAFSWNCVKLTITRSYTMYAKIIACYEARIQAIWLDNFFSKLNIVNFIFNPPIFMFYSKNNKRSSDLKHVEIKYFVFRDKIK